MPPKHALLGATILTAFAVAALAPSTEAQTYNVLHNFSAGTDGLYPFGTLRRDRAGHFYGTTYQGGAYGAGTVYKVAPDGTLTTLYSFSGTDGSAPESRVEIDFGTGDLYGTTTGGGANGNGTVWRLAPDGTETVLHSFVSATDGNVPVSGLTRDPQGNSYGVAAFGGAHNDGTLFKMGADGSFTVLHAFAGGTDESDPFGRPIRDRAGDLYGTTRYGGAHNQGTIYKIAPDGTESVLYSFSGANDGRDPLGALDRDKAGNLYGAASLGGVSNNGTVFRLAPDGTFTVLHAFTGGNDGYHPQADVVLDSKGNLYSTTFYGGGACNCGTVFKLAPDGTETILHSFTGPPGDGENPNEGLAKGPYHTLYGTTAYGGAYTYYGTVFSVTEQ